MLSGSLWPSTNIGILYEILIFVWSSVTSFRSAWKRCARAEAWPLRMWASVSLALLIVQSSSVVARSWAAMRFSVAVTRAVKFCAARGRCFC